MKHVTKMLVLPGLLALGACVTTPPEPSEEMAAARTAISFAEDNGAADYAAVELRQARDKLEQARAAMAEGQTLRARRLAEQAELDARYADLRTRSGKMERSISELEASIRALREELRRASQS